MPLIRNRPIPPATPSRSQAEPDYVQKLEGLLNDLRFDPTLLDVEIQEHVLFGDAMKNYSVCRALADLGIRIASDDFGTGSCSLAYLAKSPIASLKIDRAFIADLHENDRSRAALDGAIALARSLGLQSVAEGVETAEQAEYVQKAGCDLMQGYSLMQPLDVVELNDFMDLTYTRRLAKLWLDQ